MSTINVIDLMELLEVANEYQDIRWVPVEVVVLVMSQNTLICTKQGWWPIVEMVLTPLHLTMIELSFISVNNEIR